MHPMFGYLRDRLVELDRLLRGDSTRPDAIQGQTLNVSARGLALLATLLAMFYGACMGSFSLLKSVPAGLDDPYGPLLQVVASTIKVPALFFLTLLVTLPSLYVATALIGSRLTLLGMTRLLVGSLAVTIAVLASLGTIVLFFSLTTGSYPFIVLLNVAVFTVAGILGLMFLLQTLHRVTLPARPPVVTPSEVVPSYAVELEPIAEGEKETEEEQQPELVPSALDMPRGQSFGRHTRVVFRCWIVLFALVGAQMGWVLRPFIGNPASEFTWFRPRQSNFFSSVMGALYDLLTGG